MEYGSLSKVGNSVDGLRINSWLEIYEKGPSLPFFNLGDICFTNYPDSAPPKSVLLGPSEISSVIQTGRPSPPSRSSHNVFIIFPSPLPTANAKLGEISDKLFQVANVVSVIKPAMTEVECDWYSEEELDVQRSVFVSF